MKVLKLLSLNISTVMQKQGFTGSFPLQIFFCFFLIRCHNSACTKHYCFILFPYAGFKLVIIYHSSHNEKKGDIYIYIYIIVYLIEMFWCFLQDFNLSVI